MAGKLSDLLRMAGQSPMTKSSDSESPLDEKGDDDAKSSATKIDHMGVVDLLQHGRTDDGCVECDYSHDDLKNPDHAFVRAARAFKNEYARGIEKDGDNGSDDGDADEKNDAGDHEYRN